MKRYILTTLAVFLVCRFAFSQQSASSFIGPERGSLVIVGGGKVPAEIWAKFIELAGGEGANIVVIPTAQGDSSIHANKGFSPEKELLEKFGVATVKVLHTTNPTEANSEIFVAPIRKATGVWFVGGRQWRLADSYLNTLTHKALKDLLDRNGVIGGTSAGATIQGSFLLRGDTKANTVLEGDHVQGLDFIHNVAIDQHILPRNRQFDLIPVIRKYPSLLGIGIDESTAIVVKQNQFEVIGNSVVAIYDVTNFDGKKENPSGESGNNGPFYFLSKGQKFDLKARKTIKTK
ncbi:cyanophycinase [Emticicia sp. TH156]|uniref:cyanophycinase n=1 Tax=Emticicia sp. TH156 TaxID=2067454 RepID=UPI000C7677B8|nr:cyanophycinase [Emticicia sp. TH156]PLK42497.1 peptidase S51 [Emticicia sp. TH156]